MEDLIIVEVLDEVNSNLQENGYTAFWKGLKKAKELGYDTLDDLIKDIESVY